MRRLSFVLLLLGCATPSSGTYTSLERSTRAEPFVDVGPLVAFPSADEVERLVSRLTMPSEGGSDRVPFPLTPTITIPSIDTVGQPHEATSPVGSAVAEAVAGRGDLTASAATRCLAAASATVVTIHGALPDDVHQELLALACGTASRAEMTFTTRWEIDPRASDARIQEQARATVVERLASLPPGAHEVGAAFVRQGRFAAVAFVYGRPKATFESTQLIADEGGRVVVRGTLQTPADLVLGVITQGELGARVCTTSPEVESPRFELTCVLEGDDGAALVDVLAHRPGRTTFDTGGTVLVRRTPEEVELLLPQVPAPRADASYVEALTELVQGVRQRLGLPPVHVETAPSAEISLVAPAMVAAGYGSDTRSGETLMMGLLAGRSVEGGWIRSGDVVSVGRPGKVTPQLWLTYSLMHPATRYALVDPDMDAIGVGAADGDVTAAAIVTWRFFEDREREADADVLFARLVDARRKRGLPEPRRVHSRALRAELPNIRRNTPAMAVLDRALTGTVAEWSRDVSGLAQELMDPRAWPVPEELLEPGPLLVDLAVEYRRAEGGDWGQLVALMVVAR